MQAWYGALRRTPYLGLPLWSVDDRDAGCSGLEPDCVNAALPLDIRGVDAQVQIIKFDQMIEGTLIYELFATDPHTELLAIEPTASHNVGVADQIGGPLAITVLISRMDAVQTQTIAQRLWGHNHTLNVGFAQFHLFALPSVRGRRMPGCHDIVVLPAYTHYHATYAAS